MEQRAVTFLKALLDAPGPSGFETMPARVWRTEAEQVGADVRVDVSGNSFATLGNPTMGPHVMFAGHVDEIGLMIIHVDDDGFAMFDPIGGWDSQVFVGQRVTILGREGLVPGVIGKKAIHQMEPDDRTKVSKPKDLWIDIGASSREEALTLIRVGDPAVLAGGAIDFPNGRLVSRCLDNRIGAFVVLEALRLLTTDPPTAAVTAVATTQEEISYTGGGARTSATGMVPSVALVVDVTHASDHPGGAKKRQAKIALGGGPVLSRGAAVNGPVFDLLIEVAESESIPYTIQAAPRATGTDADAIFTSSAGIPTGLVSVPNRYMHSPNEMVALEDLVLTARLFAAFARRVTSTHDFIPR